MTLQPITTGTSNRTWLIENLIRTDEGLLRNITQADIEGGVAAANGMLALISEALTVVRANGGAAERITSADVIAISDYIRADATRLALFTEYHGDDENGSETGFHLVQGDGADTRLFQRNAINTVLDGMFHIGFAIEDGRFVNEDGNANARIADVADWLDYFYSDVSTTGTALDRITETILQDYGLMKRVKADDLMDGARAADAMNVILDEALNAVAADAMAAGSLDAQDVIAVSEYIRTHHQDAWVQEHGDDEGDTETGFHLVQNDGGRVRAFGEAVVNTVADGIYHLGFGTSNDYTRLINEDGDNNAEVTDIAVWLNGILFDTPVIAGDNGDDSLTGTDAAEQIQGDRGHDVINAGGGDDTIYGEAGHDTLFGEDGDDLFVAGLVHWHADHYDGGNGFDVIDGTAADTLYIRGGLDQGDSIEQILGNGSTTLRTHGEDSVLDLSTTELVGIDKIKGEHHRDRITGSDADELIYGEGGNDTLNGGGGDDTLNGGYGDDRYIFADGGGNDEIRSFNARSDTIVLLNHDNVATFDDLLGLMTEIDGSAFVDFGNGDSLEIVGLEIEDVTQANFEILA